MYKFITKAKFKNIPLTSVKIKMKFQAKSTLIRLLCLHKDRYEKNICLKNNQ